MVCNDNLATQLSRPRIFADEDERIAQAVEAETMGKPRGDDGGVTIERIA